MAVANHEIQVQWDSGNNSKSVGAGGTATSDAFSFSATAIDAMVTLKADNAGSPASGDTIEFYLLATCGDPDGASTDEYPADSDEGILLGVLDTHANDPAVKTLTCPIAKGGKLHAQSNASSNAITVSACLNEKTVS
ncbi:MAG: hypothetical protein JW993_02115 [Sedimentisphaerales bacterium]|nr:hypothetical protein [Sedimentisphaerales bacterium]